MINKKRLYLLLPLLILSFAVNVFAMQVSIYGPSEYIRDTGKPVEIMDAFSGTPGEAILCVTNGDESGNNKISSAYIVVNNELIVSPDNLNKEVSYFEVPIIVQEQNTIAVEVRSEPGCYLSVEVKGEGEPGVSGVIGPEGGMIEVIDPDSPIYGAKMEVPEEAVQGNTTITIAHEADVPDLPPSYLPAGPTVNFESSLNFQSKVKLVLPVNTFQHYKEGWMGAFFFDTHLGEWVFYPGLVSILDNTVTVRTDHTSFWQPGVNTEVPFASITTSLTGLYPEDDQDLVGDSLELDWTRVASADKYAVEVYDANDQLLTTIIKEDRLVLGPATHHSLIDFMQAGESYGWRVRAQIDGNWDEWSEMFRFNQSSPATPPTASQVGDEMSWFLSGTLGRAALGVIDQFNDICPFSINVVEDHEDGTKSIGSFSLGTKLQGRGSFKISTYITPCSGLDPSRGFIHMEISGQDFSAIAIYRVGAYSPTTASIAIDSPNLEHNRYFVKGRENTYIKAKIPGYSEFDTYDKGYTSNQMMADICQCGLVSENPCEGDYEIQFDDFILGIEERPGTNNVRDVALSPDEQLLYVAHWQSGSVQVNDPIGVFSTANHSLLDKLGVGGCAGGVIVSQDGRYVFGPSYYGGSVARFDTLNGNAKTTLSLSSWANMIWKTPDSNRAIVSYRAASGSPTNQTHLALIDISGNNFSLIDTLNAGRPVGDFSVAFSSDSSLMYDVAGSSTSEGVVLLEISLNGSIAINRKSEVLAGGPNSPNQMAGVVLFDNKFYVGDRDNMKIHIVDETSFLKIDEINLAYAPRNIALHPDGRHLFVLSGTDCGQISVWDLQTESEVGSIDCTQGVPQLPTYITFTDDGGKIYVAHSDFGSEAGGVSVWLISE